MPHINSAYFFDLNPGAQLSDLARSKFESLPKEVQENVTAALARLAPGDQSGFVEVLRSGAVQAHCEKQVSLKDAESIPGLDASDACYLREAGHESGTLTYYALAQYGVVCAGVRLTAAPMSAVELEDHFPALEQILDTYIYDVERGRIPRLQTESEMKKLAAEAESAGWTVRSLHWADREGSRLTKDFSHVEPGLELVLRTSYEDHDRDVLAFTEFTLAGKALEFQDINVHATIFGALREGMAKADEFVAHRLGEVKARVAADKEAALVEVVPSYSVRATSRADVTGVYRASAQLRRGDEILQRKEFAHPVRDEAVKLAVAAVRKAVATGAELSAEAKPARARFRHKGAER
ncbi:hypothetical protein [Ramlibacter alkalitolerans]|uniref:Uncharacterized protein n=1 Tax=Ramlibacter alkalitolerans TaxID=2039631 RepID=A0ABS1JTS7_9BURK|nr:hypothetical protein [Ramlibacter alkalitolerans]MBL0427685.1 hypothetical protein [Ramlibacter alkalitolerans]